MKPGRKFKLQNPLRQNYRHVKAISEFLEIEEDRLHSLVMFWGECEFKTPMPANVMGYARFYGCSSYPKCHHTAPQAGET